MSGSVFIVLGSSSGMPKANRACAGYALQVGGGLSVMDCGGGVCSSFLKAGLDPCDIERRLAKSRVALPFDPMNGEPVGVEEGDVDVGESAYTHGVRRAESHDGDGTALLHNGLALIDQPCGGSRRNGRRDGNAGPGHQHPPRPDRRAGRPL